MPEYTSDGRAAIYHDKTVEQLITLLGERIAKHLVDDEEISADIQYQDGRLFIVITGHNVPL